ncbi:MAG: amino acid adenylation domain-containing protein, partial [Ginsengibacter sp.]
KSRQKLAEDLEAEVIEIDSTEINEESSERLQLNIKPGSLAYVIYTSGSTGKPKGVMIEHSSLVNYLTNSKANYIKNETTGAGSFLHLSFTFDGSLTALFMPLITAKAIVIASGQSINVFEDENLQKYSPFDFIKITPSHLELLGDIGNSEKWLTHTLVIGGEALYPGHFKPFVTRGIDVEIVNEYGPTEATVGCSTYRFSTLESNRNIQEGVPIGKPMDNVKMYILNEGHELQPLGAQGEIYIGGAGIARGYLNREELTKERFVENPFGIKNPFSSIEAPVLYKTGDLGRWLANGDIEYAGRTDDQVKIRGYRIELGEIENEILQSGLVQQAVVLAVAGTQGEKHLAGYFVPEGSFTKEKLTGYLQSKLPAYMIPAIWMELAEMPITTNGKIDKKALPQAGIGVTGNEYEAPGNELERKLVDIWQAMLQVERVGIHDNFFELGGHSLLAMRMVSAVRKQLAIEMPIKNLFLYPTVAKLALQLQGNHTSPVLPAIVAGERPAQIPLSYSQERLWFIDQMEGSVQYHIPMVLHLTGILDKKALEKSLQEIVNRHEILRTAYLEGSDKVYQYIQSKNLWRLTEEGGEIFKIDKEGLQEYIQQKIKEPFDLEKDHMLRATLLKFDENEYLLIVSIHHIATDGWSMPIIIKEVTALYKSYSEDKPSSLSPLEIQYADYAIWQRNYLQGEVFERKVKYWKEKLEGVAPLLLPTDYPRPAKQSQRGSVKKFNIPKELSDQLHQLSHKEGATIFMTLMAGLNILLQKYSGQEDICIGTPIANRTQHEAEDIVGFFINTLALRSEVKEELTFKELLQQVRTTTMEAYEHQDLPFEKVVEAVVKERDQSRSPLFQVMLVLQNIPEVPRVKVGELTLSKQEHEHTTSKFDLTFTFTETEDGLRVVVFYCTDLFREKTIERIISHFGELLSSIVSSPDETIAKLQMLTSAERQQILGDFNNTYEPYPNDKSIVDLFEEQVLRTPDNIAVIFENESITYSELNKRANKLAYYLRKKGVNEETLVPLCVERSTEMMIGILGILKAGGAYVPIDSQYPEDRIRFMLEDTAADIMVSSTSMIAKLPKLNGVDILELDNDDPKIGNNSAENLKSNINGKNLAYIIYTSGSTGKPKGVMVTHNNVVSLVKGTNYVSLHNDDVLLSTGSSSFDATTFEYWGMLLNGGQLILCGEARLLNSELLKQEINQRGVTKMWFTSSWFNQLVDTDVSIFQGLKTILVGGEKLSQRHIEKLRLNNSKVEIINGYGPTENTTFSLTYKIKNIGERPSIPIGRPLSNRTTYVLDKLQQLVPIGVAGEIYLGGAGLARGYLNQSGLTQEKFMEVALDKNEVVRLYKTGDMGRWLSDGNVEYLGRIDDQVKIRGYRIELGEIETVLLQSGLVTDAVVLARLNKDETRQLVGYIISDDIFDKEEITSYLHTKLPDHMVPALWVSLEQFPLTSNGKINKKALPEPDATEYSDKENVGPRNEIEASLVEIWKELLDLESVGIHDNFFELGGHSLLAINLVSTIRKKLNIEFAINDVFIYPTIAGIAENVAQKIKPPASPVVNVKYLVTLNKGRNSVPLYIVCGPGGTALRFKNFAKLMDREQTVYSLQAPVDNKNPKDFPDTVEDIARIFIKEIEIENPDGPYALSGHCQGGFVALEMARQLQERGKKIHLVALFDTVLRNAENTKTASIKKIHYLPLIIKKSFSKLLLKINFEFFLFRKHTKHAIRYKANSMKLFLYKMKYRKKLKSGDLDYAGLGIFEKPTVYSNAFKNYKLTSIDHELILFYAKERYYFTDSEKQVAFKKLYLNDRTKNLWNQYATSIKVHEIQGDHSTMFETKHAHEFAKILQNYLNTELQ